MTGDWVQELRQLLNAEGAEAFAEERKGQRFSVPSVKAFASSALKTNQEFFGT